jgi:hypothetical protein
MSIGSTSTATSTPFHFFPTITVSTAFRSAALDAFGERGGFRRNGHDG